MKSYQLMFLVVSILLLSSITDAKKKRHHKFSDDSSESKTKTKTKWSSSSNLSPQTKNSMVATEEHGYYIKRTFQPLERDNKNSTALKSPPFLAIPIAWFTCKDIDCQKLNSLAINSNKYSLQEGFLCDDDCTGPYEPICGKTSFEVALFYNKCKLNVAKCRSHGFWSDLAYEECQTLYAEEVKHAEKKFRMSPFFRNPEEIQILQENNTEVSNSEAITTNDLINTTEQILIQEINDTERIPIPKESYREAEAIIKL